MRYLFKLNSHDASRVAWAIMLFCCVLIKAPLGWTAEFEASKEYRQYCGACHGENGDGQGEAGRYLYPKPRDFVNGQLRLSTATNTIASTDDIKQLLVNGIPNTSMQSWKQLSAGLIDRLVVEVQQMQILGARQRAMLVLKEDGLLVDDDGQLNAAGQQAVVDYRTQQTVPTQPWVAPAPLTITPTVLERGRKIYLKQNCHKCHGDEGDGSFGVDLVDDKGFPAFARDLINDPYKAGNEFNTVARVIRLGMPGTVMPSSGALSDAELAQLTHYVRSLAKSPSRQMGNIQRYHRAIGFRQ